MKSFLGALILGFAAVFNLSAAPTSAEQLRSEVETALKTSDTIALKLLLNLHGISDETNSCKLDFFIQNFFGSKIESVKLGSLHPNEDHNGDKVETDDGLAFFNPSIPAIGIIRVKSQSADTNDSPSEMELAYGSTNNAFYLCDTVIQKVPRSALKEIPLTIIVTIGGGNYSATGDFTQPGLTTFVGSCSYIKNGKEIKVDISGNASRTNAFLGGYVKSCTVQKTSGRGWINLYVLEDGRKTFVKKQQMTGKGITVEDSEKDPAKELISYKIENLD
jgi:hypothetical protein